jgi:hypothetical protein
MTRPPTLHPRTAQYLAALRAYRMKHGHMPAPLEFARIMGTHKQSVNRALNRLVQLGHLRKTSTGRYFMEDGSVPSLDVEPLLIELEKMNMVASVRDALADFYRKFPSMRKI